MYLRNAMKFNNYRLFSLAILIALTFSIIKPMYREVGEAFEKTAESMHEELGIPKQKFSLEEIAEKVQAEAKAQATKLDRDLVQHVEQLKIDMPFNQLQNHLREQIKLFKSLYRYPEQNNKLIFEYEKLIKDIDHLHSNVKQLVLLKTKLAALNKLIATGDEASLRVAREFQNLNPPLSAHVNWQIEGLRKLQSDASQKLSNFWKEHPFIEPYPNLENEIRSSATSAQATEVAREIENKNLQAYFAHLRELLKLAPGRLPLERIEASVLDFRNVESRLIAFGETERQLLNEKEQLENELRSLATYSPREKARIKSIKDQLKRVQQTLNQKTILQKNYARLRKQLADEQTNLRKIGSDYFGRSTQFDLAREINYGPDIATSGEIAVIITIAFAIPLAILGISITVGILADKDQEKQQ